MKARFLVVDDEVELLDLIQILIIDMIENCEVVTCTSSQDAVAKLKKDKNFQAILCDYYINQGSGAEIYQFVCKSKLTIPIILISGGFLADYPEFEGFETKCPGNLFLPKPFDEGILLSHLKDIISNESAPAKLQSAAGREYIKFSIKHLLSHPNLCPDAYIKLGKDKLVLAVRKGEVALAQLEHFKLKGHNYLYIKRSDFSVYFQAVFSKSVKDQESYLKIWDESFTITQDLVKHLGLDPLLKEVVDQVIEECLKDIHREKKISDTFKKLAKERPFIISHSILCCYLSSQIYQKISWATPNILRAHIRCALLHDLYATPQDLSSEAEVLTGENEQFYHHISQATALVAKLWPDDHTCEQIVRNHHELPLGRGGPKHLHSDAVSGPCAVFNLGHLIACELLRRRMLSKEDLVRILAEHTEFESGAYLAPYQVACEIWKNT